MVVPAVRPLHRQIVSQCVYCIVSVFSGKEPGHTARVQVHRGLGRTQPQSGRPPGRDSQANPPQAADPEFGEQLGWQQRAQQVPGRGEPRGPAWDCGPPLPAQLKALPVLRQPDGRITKGTGLDLQTPELSWEGLVVLKTVTHWRHGLTGKLLQLGLLQCA